MTIEALAKVLDRHGQTDHHYLRTHYRRMRRTLDYMSESSELGGAYVLDLGAHWLHLSVMLASRGCHVTAADFAITLEEAGVVSIAAEQGIQRVIIENLTEDNCLVEIPTASQDIVLMAETLEHLAFNPRAMWSEVDRVLKPGGRIVMTTPNYYSLPDRLRAAFRFVTGRGGSLSVEKVISQPTYAHHWKEYSAREIRRYVELLELPLRVSRIVHTNRGARNPKPDRVVEWIFWPLWAVAPFLRRDLHIELNKLD